MKLIYGIITISLLLATILSGEVLSGGFYLERGIGLPRKLEIGDKKAEAQEGDWVYHTPTGLKYKVNDRHFIVLIKCEHDRCITDRQITVGTTKETLLRRFGNPVREKKLNNAGGTFYEYQGIGFEINNEGIIQAIYIFPIFKK